MLFFGLVFLLLLQIAMLSWSASPPISTLTQARLALSRARHAEAHRYVPKLLETAENSWERTMSAWRRENKKWSSRRDFRSTLDLARVAMRQAQRAEAAAKAMRDSLQFAAAAELVVVKQKIDEFKIQFAHLPVATTLRQKFVSGELLMLEGESAFNRGDFGQAANKARKAALLVGSAGTNATKILRDYLVRLPEWQSWARETIAWSAAENATALIVDKLAHRCQVYVSGRLVAEYPIELGPRWLGHKKQRGDGATPEGFYRVIKKKGTKQSKYYKALEIDYPNNDDQQQFLTAKQNGDLPPSAQIGGLIEIHGDGGKGLNWTSGCVALRNQDLDKVFELAKVGTRVTIVGALKGLSSANHTSNHLVKKNSNHAKSSPASSH